MEKPTDTTNTATAQALTTPSGSRWLIYRPNRRNYLCVVAARDSKAALKTARRMFICPRGTVAIPERHETRLDRVMQQASASEAWRKSYSENAKGLAQMPAPKDSES